MIITAYISTDSSEENFSNGLNIEISRLDAAWYIEMKIIDNSDQKIIKTFEINYKELKRAILKLDTEE